MLSSLLNLRFRGISDTEEKFNRLFAVIAIIFIAVLFPLLIILFVTKLPMRYRTEKTYKKYESLFLSVDKEKKMGMMMLAFSLYRKFFLIAVTVVLDLNVV